MLRKVVGSFKVALLVGGALLAVAEPSQAATGSTTGFVLNVRYMPGSSSFGSYGYVQIDMTSQANANQWIGAYTICSTGATASQCSAPYLYRENALLTLFERLHVAEEGDQKIGVHWDGSQVRWINFYTDNI